MPEQNSDSNQASASLMRAVIAFLFAILAYVISQSSEGHIVAWVLTLIFIYMGVAELVCARLLKRGVFHTDSVLAYRYLAFAGLSFLTSVLLLAVAIMVVSIIAKCVFAAMSLVPIYTIIDSILKYHRIKREMNSQDESSI